MAAAVPIVLGVISLATQVAGGAKQDKAINAQTQTNIKVNEREAELLEDQADQVVQEGVMAEYDIVQQGEQFIGQQKAGASGSGIALDTGTTADLLSETQMSIGADVATTRSNYARERRRLLEGAKFTRENAATIQQQGQFRRQGAALQTAGNAIGTGATLAERWYNYQNT